MTTRADALFDEPDIPADLEERELQITTTYHATLARTGERWTATVQNPPDGHSIQVEGSIWREAADNVMESVAAIPGHDPEATGFFFMPADSEAADLLKEVHAARAARHYAEQAERDAVRTAARALVAKGWTNRDIGSVLGLSQERISQIIPAA